ncbi:MAG: GAF domain-containing sensor histidine kinase [Chloroflexota bacterium]|jgi:signal transduction histidine kinase
MTLTANEFLNTVYSGDRLLRPAAVFRLLILYRWFSLVPPLIALLLGDGDPGSNQLAALAGAIALNVLISLTYTRLNQAVLARPWLLGVDLALAAGLVAWSGGWQTPYYLYALSPLFVAAFFFQLRGALIAATAFAVLYLTGVFIAYDANGVPPDWLTVATALVGAFLIGGAFGFASDLVQRLRLAGDRLAEAHRDLQVIHDLTVSLQSAADVTEVEERVLEAVTRQLAYPKAFVALVDRGTSTITAWMGRARDGMLSGALTHSTQLAIDGRAGAVGQALTTGRRRLMNDGPLTADEKIDALIGLETTHVFPLLLREHSVGVLLVDASEGRDDPTRLQSLEAIANQAAVSLGTTMLCIDRAQQSAVQEERIRIAHDIHDTVSQSLFGIVYTLDGCLKLLPGQPEAVVPELQRVLAVAEETRAEIRKSILDMWPSKMTAELFVDDLRKYVSGICQADDLKIDFNVSEGFSRLSSRARRGLYRISQEALANIAHHASAGAAQVCVEVAADRAMLSIRDDGRGFDAEVALKRAFGRDHFGLRGMQERAVSLNGACEINSRPGAGTSIVVDIPIV